MITFLVLSVVVVAVVGVVSYLRARDALETSAFARLETAADAEGRLARPLGRRAAAKRRVHGRAPRRLHGPRLRGRDRARRRAARGRHAPGRRTRGARRRPPDARLRRLADGRRRGGPRPRPRGQDRRLDDPAARRRLAGDAAVLRPRRVGHVRPARAVARAHRQADDRGRDAALRGRRPAHRRRRRVPQPRAGRPHRPPADGARRVGRDVRRGRGPQDPPLRRSGSRTRSRRRGSTRRSLGRDGQALYENYRDEPVVGVYRWLPEIGAALVAEQSQSEAFAPARRLAVTIGGIGALFVALLGVGIYVASRRIARPILAITETATAVAAGDLTREAPVMTEDEVGELAGAFNDMTAQLRENVETLEQRVEERTAELAEALETQRAAEERYRRARRGAAAGRVHGQARRDRHLRVHQPARRAALRLPDGGLDGRAVLRIGAPSGGPGARAGGGGASTSSRARSAGRWTTASWPRTAESSGSATTRGSSATKPARRPTCRDS